MCNVYFVDKKCIKHKTIIFFFKEENNGHLLKAVGQSQQELIDLNVGQLRFPLVLIILRLMKMTTIMKMMMIMMKEKVACCPENVSKTVVNFQCAFSTGHLLRHQFLVQC